MTTNTESPSAGRKPQISYFFASAFGLGYLKPGPGTWGSLAGSGISILVTWMAVTQAPSIAYLDYKPRFWTEGWGRTPISYIILLFVAILGVFVAGEVERHYGKTDPQFVVIDEVSGQLIAYSLPFYLLNWKTWLLGFILFRVFDIWKPFPARQAESLPGGWGIMADDWVAGIYAALGLWIFQALGLLK